MSIRYNYMLQYAPELLGEKAQIPELTDESEEGIRAYLQDLENREKVSVAVRRLCVNFGKYTVMFTDIMELLKKILKQNRNAMKIWSVL